jgi:hypothetical protein
MNELVPLGSPTIAALVTAAGEHAPMRFLESDRHDLTGNEPVEQ